MTHKLFYIFTLIFFSLSVTAENASNVHVRQRNKDIVITYDLSKTSNVRVYVASSKQPTYTQLNAVEGAVGKRVHSGQNLEIIWHPLEEKDNFIADGVQFKVEALGIYEDYASRRTNGGKSNMETFITIGIGYSTTPQMSYDLTFGQTYKGFGWYVNARSNFLSGLATNGLSCKEGGYIDSTLPFYSGKTKSSILVFNAGFVLDIIEVAGKSKDNRFNTFGFYIGGGYGKRQVLWETTDGQWIKYRPTSYSGFSANGGLIGSIYGLTLKLGINSINFKYHELEAGIGWMF